MNNKTEIWECRLGCGEFKTKAQLRKCPKCKTRKVWFIKDISQEQNEVKE